MIHKLLLAVLALGMLLSSTACGSPTTTDAAIAIAVNTFIGVEIVAHGGSWTYTQLSTDLASLLTGWATATQTQRLAYIATITADLKTVPNCDVKCQGYATIAINDIADIIVIVQSSHGIIAGPSEKQQVQAVFAKWQRDYKAAKPRK